MFTVEVAMVQLIVMYQKHLTCIAIRDYPTRNSVARPGIKNKEKEKQKMLNNKKKNAFTITELVIVIAVIAILAAVLIPTFSNVIEKANESAALQEARNAMTEWTLRDDYNGESLENLYIASGNYLFQYVGGELKLQKDAEGNNLKATETKNENKTSIKLGEENILTLASATTIYTYVYTVDEKTYSGYTVSTQGATVLGYEGTLTLA